MKLQNLFSVVLMIGLICLVYTGGQAKPRQTKAKGTNTVQFDLCYDFSVPRKTSKIKFIVILPKTIPYKQRIYDITYSPEPSRIFSENGNDYAEFVFVEPKKQFQVKINIKAKLLRYDLSTARKKGKLRLSSDFDPNDFLKQEKYIEKDDLLIQIIAKSIKGQTEIDIVKNIYNHVIDNMEYGGYNKKDSGALNAALRKKGDCSDYTHLLTALCRAKNVPARVISGYTKEFNVTPKHTWAEVYLQRYGWVPFDPMLGDKKDKFVRRNKFHTLEPIYIYFSKVSNDEVIGGNWYTAWWYWGDEIEVKDSITFK